jgi:hypothetical protein
MSLTWGLPIACQVRTFVLLQKNKNKNCVTIELTIGVNGVLLNIYDFWKNYLVFGAKWGYYLAKNS